MFWGSNFTQKMSTVTLKLFYFLYYSNQFLVSDVSEKYLFTKALDYVQLNRKIAFVSLIQLHMFLHPRESNVGIQLSAPYSIHILSRILLLDLLYAMWISRNITLCLYKWNKVLLLIHISNANFIFLIYIFTVMSVVCCYLVFLLLIIYE